MPLNDLSNDLSLAKVPKKDVLIQGRMYLYYTLISRKSANKEVSISVILAEIMSISVLKKASMIEINTFIYART